MAVYQGGGCGDDYYEMGEEIDPSIPRVHEAADFDRLALYRAAFNDTLS